MQRAGGGELRVEAVDVFRLDSAACGSGEKRFGARADGSLREVVPRRPAFVAGSPEVDARIVALQNREALIDMQRAEPQLIAVVGHRRRDVANGERGNRAREAWHGPPVSQQRRVPLAPWTYEASRTGSAGACAARSARRTRGSDGWVLAVRHTAYQGY